MIAMLYIVVRVVAGNGSELILRIRPWTVMLYYLTHFAISFTKISRNNDFVLYETVVSK